MKWNYLWIFLYCFICEVQGQNNWHSNYNYIESFNEGVAVVKKNNKCAVVDFKGKEIIPLEYDEIKRIDRKFFKVRKNSRYGLFDKAGNIITLKIETSTHCIQINATTSFDGLEILVM